MERPNFFAKPASPGASTPSSPTQAVEGDLGQRYKKLRQEHDRLNENRMRRTLMLQQATEEDERCRQEAQAFGANTPEELEEILEGRRQEAAKRLAEFERALEEEAALQQQVEQDLAAMENR